jgi:hypothetical protein
MKNLIKKNIDWNSEKENLEKLVSERKSNIEIGSIYGVSDEKIRRVLKSLDIIRTIPSIRNDKNSRRCSDEDIINNFDKSTSIADLLRNVGLKDNGGSRTWIKGKLIQLKLDISIFQDKKNLIERKTNPIKLEIKDILTKDSTYPSTKLKYRLINEGLKEAKCECCGLTEWNGNPIPLQLHHINGDHFDNRLENL